MYHHYQPGRNLEQILETIDDPAERSVIIDEAWECLGRIVMQDEVATLEVGDGRAS